MEKYSRARQATDDNIIQCMRFACWITKTTDTHTEYVLLIAFSRQQWLHKRASMLRYTYIARLVFPTVNSLCFFPVLVYPMLLTAYTR